MMVPLLLALQVATAPAARTPSAAARTIVLEATRSIARDSGVAARARWTQRLRRNPRDREARLGLATLSRLTFDFADADRRYAELLPAGNSAEDAIQLYSMLGRSLVSSQQWQVVEAMRALRATVANAQRLNEPLVEAEATLALASYIGRSVGIDSALALTNRVSSLIGSDTTLAIAHQCSLAALLRGSAPVRADSIVRETLRVAEAFADARLIGRCNIVRSLVSEILGRQAQAVAAITIADEQLRLARDWDGVATANQLIAYQSVYTITLDRGRRAATDAIEYGAQSGNRAAAAWARLNRAQLALRIDDAPAAMADIEQATLELAGIGDATGLAAARIVRGDAARSLERPSLARAAYDSARTFYARSGWLSQIPALDIRLAAVDRRLGDTTAARIRIDSAVAIAGRIGLRGIAGTDHYYERGLLALDAGRYTEAAANFQAFIDHLGSASPIAVDARVRLAEAQARAGRLDDATATLQRGFLDLDFTRALLKDRDMRIAALQSGRFEMDPDLGIASVINILARSGRVAVAFNLAEAQRARFLWTQMVRRRALAGDTTLKAGDDRLAAPPLDIQSVRSSLPAGAALVEYVTGQGGEPTTAFLIHRGEALAISLVTGDSLLDDINRLAASLESGGQARALARRISERIFMPVVAALPPGVSRLIIAPDGPLHRLAFDVLDPGDGSAAIERFVITTVPSARIASLLRAEPSRTERAGVLAFGDAVFASSARLPRLPASADEVRAIARSARTSTMLRSAASEATFRRRVSEPIGVLHIATHARVEDGGLMSSAFFLAPGNGQDGRIGVDEIATLNVNADLVVLSACRTIGGLVVRGEGLQGLTAPFLEAGTRAVVATYWPIGDRALIPVMRSFYENLSRGAVAADALRQAKLDSRRSGAPVSVWAALTLTGDGELRPRLR